MASGKKQYGLIIPKKAKEAPKLKRPAVFGGDSSSEDEQETIKSKYGSAVWRENKRNAQKLESHESVVKAMAEDPSVYEYDSLYDKMVEDKRKADPRLQKKDTKSKYISRLKTVAERRKLEQELVYERKVAKELEKEGSIDKQEIYLTTAYKKKLEERKQLEKELLEEEAIEKANDVTKQKDLTKFHKHLFNRITQPSTTESKTDSKTTKPTETQTQQEEKVDDNTVTNSPSSPASNEPGSPEQPETSDSQPTEIVEATEPEPVAPKITAEERRKAASVKRTDSEAQLSARERYLARKKMKLSKPTAGEQH